MNIDPKGEKPERKREEDDADIVWERPLECDNCQKPIVYHYTEIIGDAITHTGHCAECPVLLRRLHGLPPGSEIYAGDTKTGLVCGECGTTLEEVRRGSILGCSVCYEIFGDVLMAEMIANKKISPGVTKKKKPTSLHIGRSPGEILEISPSLRLLALNEALDETLKREDYEQAAWLRDQIKALTEQTKKNSDDKKS